jgi:glutamyl-tRNA synthetase
MDWGNAFVRSIRTDSTGAITSISMELHLAGDFKKTEKKITWLAEPSSSHPHIDVTLHDYDYLITKKKLEEEDDVNDFITPVTEFKVDAVADPNLVNVKKGDIIQFERKGYYILDAITPGERPHYKFVHIPDGKAASLASKAAPPPAAASGSKAQTSSTPTSVKSDPALAVDTKMYKTASVYGNDVVPPVDTKMYAVKNVYDTSS